MASSKKVGESYLYSITVEASDLEYSLGDGDVWSEPYEFSLSQSPFRAYIVSDLDPVNPRAKQLIQTILEQCRNSNKGFKVLVDLSETREGSPTLNRDYSELLAPLASSVTYQSLPAFKNDFPFNSPYTVELNNAVLAFPLINTSSEILPMSLGSFLDLSFANVNNKLRVAFQKDKSYLEVGAVKELYESKRVHLLISGGGDKYKLHGTKKQRSVQFGGNETFGVFIIDDSKSYSYRQFLYNGDLVDSFIGRLSDNESKGKSSERQLAIIVLICSMAFLCYFIYSWISCYVKKPKVKDSDITDDYGEDQKEFEERHTMSIDVL
eukprot:TRINITY_DN4527_c0_g1_i5.p1 TRINITY_DN4527_c0_g1~~TRINITY_DN4527_c0_g1_i5.p1  ORF type:complete len:323 (-),score=78.73 TRINITY_DN4527_c0_g1_i5:168-1136(-)